MKRGYSIALGDQVQADELDYSDCREFEIVCEVCRNRVYKGVRPGAYGPVHYLSHYQADSQQARDCELRVAQRIRDEEAAGAESTDRGQSLIRRLDVMHEVLLDMYPIEFPHWLPMARFARPGDEYLRMRSILVEAYRGSLDNEDDMRVIFERLRKRFARIDVEEVRRDHDDAMADLASGLRQKLQVRWALDMARTLRLAQSDRALHHLANHAWRVICERWWSQLAEEGREPDEKLRSDCARIVMNAMPYSGKRGFGHLLEEDYGDGSGRTMEVKIMILVAGTMTELLYTINYRAPLPKAQPRPGAKPKRKPRPKRTHRR